METSIPYTGRQFNFLETLSLGPLGIQWYVITELRNCRQILLLILQYSIQPEIIRKSGIEVN